MLNFMLCKIKVENIFHLFSIFLHLFILFKQKFIIEMHFAIMQRIMKKKINEWQMLSKSKVDEVCYNCQYRGYQMIDFHGYRLIYTGFGNISTQLG